MEGYWGDIRFINGVIGDFGENVEISPCVGDLLLIYYIIYYIYIYRMGGRGDMEILIYRESEIWNIRDIDGYNPYNALIPYAVSI